MRSGRLQSPVRRHGLTANLVRGQPPVAYLYAIRDILFLLRYSLSILAFAGHHESIAMSCPHRKRKWGECPGGFVRADGGQSTGRKPGDMDLRACAGFVGACPWAGAHGSDPGGHP